MCAVLDETSLDQGIFRGPEGITAEDASPPVFGAIEDADDAATYAEIKIRGKVVVDVAESVWTVGIRFCPTVSPPCTSGARSACSCLMACRLLVVVEEPRSLCHP